MSSNATRYVCHLRNVVSTTGDVNLGHGLSIRQLPGETVQSLESLGPTVYRPWNMNAPWFLVTEHLADQSKWVDGDPSGALRVIRLALLLYLGEEVGVGATVHMREVPGEKTTAPIIVFPRWAREQTFSRPDNYVIRPHDVAPIKSLFENLVLGLKNPLLDVPLRWLSKACEDRAIPSDAVLSLSIALEALYLGGEREKAKNLAQRGAAYVGLDAASRQHQYVHLACFYRARNSIVHEGEQYPIVYAGPGGSKDVVGLRDFGFSHAREAIKKTAATLPRDKAAFVSLLRKQVNANLSELQSIHSVHF